MDHYFLCHQSMSITRYSTPSIAQKRANAYFGHPVRLYRSTRKEKKYQIKDPSGKWVHFGQMGYEDFTKHHDKTRRKRYLTRATKIHGNWKKNPYSANNLAIHILW
jgi:hypothetical protein